MISLIQHFRKSKQISMTEAKSWLPGEGRVGERLEEYKKTLWTDRQGHYLEGGDGFTGTHTCQNLPH